MSMSLKVSIAVAISLELYRLWRARRTTTANGR